VYAGASARIPVGNRGDVSDVELGEAVEGGRLTLRFSRSHSFETLE